MKIYEEKLPNFLNEFIQDQKDLAFAFQIAILHKRANVMKKTISLNKDRKTTKILDRCSFLGDKVFAKTHKNRGNIDEKKWILYERESKNLQEELIEKKIKRVGKNKNVSPWIPIFLNTSVDDCVR